MSVKDKCLRQYMHNDGSGLVFGYGMECVDKYITELEAERDRLEERLDDWQRETALAKADRDKVMRENGVLNCHIDDLEIERDKLREALTFYANPETYFATSLFTDPPCGEIAYDYSDTGELGFRLGKRAREALKEQR